MKRFVERIVGLVICLNIIFGSAVTVTAQGFSEKLASFSSNEIAKNDGDKNLLANEELTDMPKESTSSIDTISQNASTNQAVDENIRYQNNNAIQNYVTEDKKVHTIYWAKGVKPPMMTSDKQKLGKPGYFEKDVTITETIRNTTYQAPIEEGKGYFDMNKSLELEKHMCYLGAATNILYWWMEQNKEYIEKYAQGVKEGKYIQSEGLVDLKNVDWNKITTAPKTVRWNDYNQQLLKDSNLAKGPFRNNYYSRTEKGYFLDPVFDFFINGYKPIHRLTGLGIAPVNKPEMYEKNSDGGYFYPVFSNQVLSERYYGSKYSFFNQNVKKWFLEGKGVSLSYFINHNVAHAITAWGAEYDENGNLCRLFVTDSDDRMNPSLTVNNTVRGLHGMNIKNVDDIFYIGNNEGSGAGNGNQLQMMVLLDLAQDKWKAVTEDQEPLPKEPKIIENPKSRQYAFGAVADPLKVVSQVPNSDADKGAFITYQWYKAEALGEIGVPIKDANKNTYTPVIKNIEATEYYYCEVTNNKYGHKNSVKTDYAKIETVNKEIKNAVTPKFNFGSKIEYFPQYSTAEIKVDILNPEELNEVKYQWYSASNNTDGGYIQKLNNETKPILRVPIETRKTQYYFCEITNIDTRASITGTTFASVKTFIKRIDVKAPVDITVKEQSEIKIDYKNNLILGVKPNFTVAQLNNILTTDGLVVEYFSLSGEKLQDFSPIGTGTFLTVKTLSGEKISEKTIVVYGDVTGDGLINQEDYNSSVQVSLENKSYSPNEKAFFTANDLNKDGVIDVLDSFEIKKIINSK